MRTVAFSNEAVIDMVNRNFTAVWKNIRPNQKFQDGLYSKQYTARLTKLPIGTGQTNICAVVATADGKILHAIQGFYSWKAFLKELQFGIDIAEALKKDGAKKLPSLYLARQKEIGKNNARRLMLGNLEYLESSPLPDIKTLRGRTNAGIR